MGALNGGITVKAFLTDGPPIEGFRDKYVDTLNAHAILPLTPESEEDRVGGWATIAHPLDTRFTHEKIFFNEYLCVAFRVDTLKVPASTLRLYQKEAELQWLAENHRETMPRPQRNNLKEQVQRDLRAKMLPSIKVVDLVWNTDTNQVWIWTHNQRVLEEVEDLFERTFDRSLLSNDPYSLGERELPEELKAKLDEVEPALFVDLDAAGGLA